MLASLSSRGSNEAYDLVPVVRILMCNCIVLWYYTRKSYSLTLTILHPVRVLRLYVHVRAFHLASTFVCMCEYHMLIIVTEGASAQLK